MELKVGDELAFRYYNNIRIHKIEKVTPSGRIICGGMTLNPDLTIRGKGGIWSQGPYKGEIVTDEIMEKVLRQKLMHKVNAINFKTLSNEQLKAIINITNS